MMIFLKDPVVLICIGIIVVGLIGLFWSISKFRHTKSAPPKAWPADVVSMAIPQRGMDAAPAFSASVPAMASSPAINKEVVDRLESMTQRLTEMQSVLLKQPAGSAAGAAGSGAVGQGFSPETIDKLLKIIGNVMQQVDILQKSMTPKV